MSKSPFIYYTEADAEADALRLLSELEGGSEKMFGLQRLPYLAITDDNKGFNLLVDGHSRNLAYLQFASETLNVGFMYYIWCTWP